KKKPQVKRPGAPQSAEVWAWREHPERFTRRPRPPRIEAKVWINSPPKETPETSDPTTQTV
ncbi:MAG: hypothetical protein ACOYBY_18705, partial [Dermatophilaceae bacterium]